MLAAAVLAYGEGSGYTRGHIAAAVVLGLLVLAGDYLGRATYAHVKWRRVAGGAASHTAAASQAARAALDGVGHDELVYVSQDGRRWALYVARWGRLPKQRTGGGYERERTARNGR